MELCPCRFVDVVVDSVADCEERVGDESQPDNQEYRFYHLGEEGTAMQIGNEMYLDMKLKQILKLVTLKFP